jgi:UPF0271 protein
MDLNADVGEGFGPYAMGTDEALLPFVTSVNIACAFHAGDPIIMERTVRAAVAAGVAIGAHPGYPDRRGFGRREMDLPPEEIEADVLYQVGALMAFVRAHGGTLSHVKPHGALYHRASRDAETAEAVARGVARAGVSILVGPMGSVAMPKAAEAHNLRFASEAFADRRYDAGGELVRRDDSEAVLLLPVAAAAQAVEIGRDRKPDTLCLHGDTRGAATIARAVREALTAAGIVVAPLAR